MLLGDANVLATLPGGCWRSCLKSTFLSARSCAIGDSFRRLPGESGSGTPCFKGRQARMNPTSRVRSTITPHAWRHRSAQSCLYLLPRLPPKNRDGESA